MIGWKVETCLGKFCTTSRTSPQEHANTQPQVTDENLPADSPEFSYQNNNETNISGSDHESNGHNDSIPPAGSPMQSSRSTSIPSTNSPIQPRRSTRQRQLCGLFRMQEMIEFGVMVCGLCMGYIGRWSGIAIRGSIVYCQVLWLMTLLPNVIGCHYQLISLNAMWMQQFLEMGQVLEQCYMIIMGILLQPLLVD
nr:hypothetical protein Iba_chr11cCG9330 [Ipomoea batatas]